MKKSIQPKENRLKRICLCEIFTIYWMLKNKGFEKSEIMANQMKEVLGKYPHWRKSDKYEMEVRAKLYGVLLHQSGITDISKVSEIAQNVLKILKGGVAG